MLMAPYLNHWCIDASPQALDLGQGEHLVLAHLANADPHILLARLQDLVRPPEPARGRRAHLHVVLAHRIPHEHGVEGGHLVHPHPGHADDLGHVMHGGDRKPTAVLPLGQV